MKSYEIIEESKEFECPEGFEILALCDEEGGIHITIEKKLSALIENKANLYEIIAEQIEAGNYFKIEDFKCYLITKKMLEDFQAKRKEL